LRAKLNLLLLSLNLWRRSIRSIELSSHEITREGRTQVDEQPGKA
jgi:hypothetical protein